MQTGLVIIFILTVPGFLSTELHTALSGKNFTAKKYIALLLFYIVLINLLVSSIGWLSNSSVITIIGDDRTTISLINFCLIASAFSIFIPAVANFRHYPTILKGALTDSVRSIVGFYILTCIIG